MKNRTGIQKDRLEKRDTQDFAEEPLRELIQIQIICLKQLPNVKCKQYISPAIPIIEANITIIALARTPNDVSLNKVFT